MPIQMQVQRGDLTAVEADAIVNSANNDLVLGGGVSGAISRVAGPAVQEECRQIGTVPLGTAVVTGAGNLKAKYILHAAVNPLGLWADAKSIRNAVRNVLQKARELQIRRIAFPAIGTGTGGFPVERCADILVEEVQKHGEGETSLEEVVFVLYDEKPFAIFDERFKEKLGLVKPAETAEAADAPPAAPPVPPA
ncbi:MAG TPA: macro domain-containing protein [Planctomycetota bacterium]|nr:macro domain-containing protein [Planctomycetota bacterium]